MRIIVNGAFGKMGVITCKTLQEHPEFTLVAQLGSHDDLHTAIVNYHPDIVIDLTSAKCVYANTLLIIQSGVHPIIGTSGLSVKQIAELTTLTQKHQLGGIIVPNFSLGAVLMMRFATQAAQYFSNVEIIEMHHTKKYDAPSGTAMRTATMLNEVYNNQDNHQLLNAHETNTNARGLLHAGIPIHSVRLPGILAAQKVVFGSIGETLTIDHNSIDRTCFMPGLLYCCRIINKLSQLYYGLDQVLNMI